MNLSRHSRLRRSLSAMASLVAVGVLGAPPSQAQYAPSPVAAAPFASPYGYGQSGGGPYGGYGQSGGNPYQQGYSAQQNPGQRGFSGQPGAANNRLTLPTGIDQLYALQSINALVLFGTKEGYDTALEVVRNIDGDLDIIRTQITLVKTTRGELTKLGVTPAGDTFTDEDIAKLVAARQAGTLRATDAVRITTRENTVVDALLGEYQRSSLPLTIVPRVTTEGLVAVQLTQPLSKTFSSLPGQTSVALLPGAGSADDSPVSLLFVTPTILPSDYRPAR